MTNSDLNTTTTRRSTYLINKYIHTTGVCIASFTVHCIWPCLQPSAMHSRCSVQWTSYTPASDKKASKLVMTVDIQRVQRKNWTQRAFKLLVFCIQSLFVSVVSHALRKWQIAPFAVACYMLCSSPYRFQLTLPLTFTNFMNKRVTFVHVTTYMTIDDL